MTTRKHHSATIDVDGALTRDIDRPALPARRVVATIPEVMGWLSHADLGV